MQEKLEKIIKILTEKNQTISTMESCTGGGVANAITNISGSSEVFHYGAVTYSNFFKEKMGVSSKVIDQYTVYSMETAKEMSKNIAIFSDSDYGIGITGILNRLDPANPVNHVGKVYISIYAKANDRFTNQEIEVTNSSREKNKEMIIHAVVEMLEKVINP